MDFYLGQIQTFAFNFAPKGWSLCQGQIINVNQNQALFALLGNSCGGDGRTTFGLPNLQGTAVVGTGQLQNGGNYVFGQKYGAETVALNATNLIAHNHAFRSGGGTINMNANAGQVDVPFNGVSLAVTSDPSSNPINEFNSATPNIALNTGGGATGGQIQNTGAAQPIPIMQPYTVVNYCIALTGIFPPRPN